MAKYKAPKIVAWPQIHGQPVYTNGYTEDALSLTPLIAGWGRQGFYVSRKTTPEKLRARMAEIAWERVQLVKEGFDIVARGFVCTRDSRAYYVSEARFKRLMRHCVNKVDATVFLNECMKAIKTAKNKTAYSSGKAVTSTLSRRLS